VTVTLTFAYSPLGSRVPVGATSTASDEEGVGDGAGEGVGVAVGVGVGFGLGGRAPATDDVPAMMSAKATMAAT
jgi:hypothetical protein